MLFRSKRVRAIADQNGLKLSLIFHAGDGNLHPQILFDERDPEQTRKVKAAGYRMLKTCVDLGGSISGEHGIGMDKRESMRWLFSLETLQQFRRIKNAFDPENLCNPDKLIPLPDKEAKAAPLPDPGGVDLSAGTFAPQTLEECQRTLGALSKGKKKFTIQSAPPSLSPSIREEAAVVSTVNLNAIIEHDAENFTVTVMAGMAVARLQEELAAKNQKTLLASEKTVGDVLSVNRPAVPRLRDQVLGLTAVLADGTKVDFGGKVMKNVAGYDATKLFLGSRGTLGLIAAVILKTYPLNYPLPVRAERTEAGAPGLSKKPAAKDSTGPVRQRIKDAFDPEHLLPDRA